jgi:precorrin-2 dehydrogenase / sirohydrochlorin ferrochelatase
MMLDVTDRLVVIVGGGAVAARKAGRLLKSGAQSVRSVALAFVREMPDAVERVEAAYEPRHLDGAGLVFAVTDVPDLNEAVVNDARDRGILVCRSDAADDDERGDFTTPSEFRDETGCVVITVATGSPSLSVRVISHLAQTLDPRVGKLAQAMRALRPGVRGRADIPAPRRREIFHAMTTDAALDVVGREGSDGLRRWLGRQFPELDAND